MKVIFLNGPPRSGKDELGRALRAELEALGTIVRVDKFARLLKEAVHRAYGIRVAFGRFADHDAFEAHKDAPHATFHGATPRAAYIAYSEEFAKPLHGKGYFGKLLAREVAMHPCDVLVITDSGFIDEAFALMDELRLHAEDCTMVHVSRPGTSFDGDSRSYVRMPEVPVMRVANVGTIEDLKEDARRIANGA